MTATDVVELVLGLALTAACMAIIVFIGYAMVSTALRLWGCS